MTVLHYRCPLSKAECLFESQRLIVWDDMKVELEEKYEIVREIVYNSFHVLL